jgi:S1-C subfamily serine protease
VILAVVAAAILVTGALLRPRTDVPGAPATMPEGELLRLAQVSQRRSLEAEIAYFRLVATNVGPSVLRVTGRDTSGVVWTGGRVVTAGGAARDLARSGAEPLFPHAATPRPRPIVAVQTAPPEAIAATRAESAPGVGDWVLAIWQGVERRAVVPGNYVGTTAVNCGGLPAQEVVTTVPLSARMAGAGLFDLGGSLIGIVLPCDDRLAAITPETVDAMLIEAGTLEGRLRDLFGMQIERLAQAEAAHVGVESGALVRTIWTGGAADRSGLRPGDVIVGLGSEPVTGRADLAPLGALADEMPSSLVVHRNGARLTLPILTMTSLAAEATGPAGMAFDVTAPGLHLGAVAPGSPAGRAGLQAGDRLLRVDGQTVSSEEQVARLLSSDPADRAIVEFARGDRRSCVLLH